MAKIRLGWPWRGTVLRGQKEKVHPAGDVVNVDADTARDLVRRGLAARVTEDTPTSASEAAEGDAAVAVATTDAPAAAPAADAPAAAPAAAAPKGAKGAGKES